MKPKNKKAQENSRRDDLVKNTENGQGEFITTNQGLRINED